MMSQEKKWVLSFALVFLWMIGVTYFWRWMGWNPPPRKPPAFAAANEPKRKPDGADLEAAGKGAIAAADSKDKPAPKALAQPAGPKPAKEGEIELVKGSELVLGSTNDRTPGGYRLRVQLEQHGAGIDSIYSALFDAEFEYGKPRKRPLEFVSRRDTKTLPGYDLRLMSSVDDVTGIPAVGNRLIILAAVNQVLHFRIFDGDSNMVVDTDANKLTEQARPIENLREQLNSLWPPHELTGSEKARVIAAVTSIAGHTFLPSLALTLSEGLKSAKNAAIELEGADDPQSAALRKAAAEAEDFLDSELWEVVRENGKVVRSVTGVNLETNAPLTGQAVVFRTTAKSGVVLTKTFRLFPETDGLEVEIKFESPDQERSTVYNLFGPHGIPIEGIWYTSTYRDLFFGQVTAPGQTKIDTHAAADVASKGSPIENTTLPLRFAGVENQYFASFVEPVPAPTGKEDRWDSRTVAILLRKDEKTYQSDVGVQITSRPIKLKPGEPVVHLYRVFAGPKTHAALHPYGAEGLASYRKPQWIPFAPDIARVLITPTLGFTYQVTERVARFFGGTRGNYGVAIILLTLLVRGLMFPLGRKQALSAQKMQSLQPHLKELQDKLKDDKEKLTKETFALYKRHGVNPVGGCLPALIQLPIFVGLWQALNTSFPLRHATFLWIRDLSAPDMLFHLPFEIPLLSTYLGQWFNVLPFIVIGLMLFQTKLFAPPATTPEAEMQQKMMKYMMVFMGVMFYKVPSGLGIYFITSSLWAIGERLLLPKVTHATATDAGGKADASEKGPTGRGSLNGERGGNQDGQNNGETTKPPGAIAQFWGRILDEARKDPTYRKVTDERGDNKDRGKDRDRDRDRDRPRPKPRRR